MTTGRKSLTRQSKPAPPAGDARASAEQTQQRTTGTRKILVAEDDPNDVVLLERAFSKWGGHGAIQFVHDGQEVIDYLTEATSDGPHGRSVPGLLLLDLKMPRVNGFEVLEWLKQQPRLRSLLVVVFSSSDDPSDIRKAYALGANSYVVKPQDAAGLSTVVHLINDYWLKINVPPENNPPSN